MMDLMVEIKNEKHLVPGEQAGDWEQTVDLNGWDSWTRDKDLEIISI